MLLLPTAMSILLTTGQSGYNRRRRRLKLDFKCALKKAYKHDDGDGLRNFDVPPSSLRIQNSHDYREYHRRFV